MSTSHSITGLIEELLEGSDRRAIDGLWERYFDRLVKLAGNRLNGHPGRVADEEDIAVNVMDCLWRGVQRGQYPDLTDRDSLWALLVTITKARVIDQIRYDLAEGRGGGNVRGDSAFTVAAQSPVKTIAGSDDVDPEFEVLLTDRLQHLLSLLRDESHRQVAEWRMEGLSVAEIAGKLGLTERSVQRKLQIIRQRWQTDLDA